MPTVTVHRSTQEIGGNCIEIAHEGHRLILDVGSPLDVSTANPAALPPTLNLDTPCDGVIISHPHQDHYGLIRDIPEEWKIWCGEPTEALMKLTAEVMGHPISRKVEHFQSFIPFDIGPFRITPFLTDHSAFDAHMILVEIAGKRILYSGDFRRTGRKSALVDRILKNPPKDIDILLLEGTTLGRLGLFPTEHELERQFVNLFQEVKGRVFVSWSAQNIDRTVTLYRACKRANRSLVLDIYSIDVLEKLSSGSPSLPQLGWENIQAVVTSRMTRMYKNPRRMNRPEFVEHIAKSGHAISAQKLEQSSNGKVIMLRPSLFDDYQKKGLTLTGDDAFVFSMWSGYLKEPEYQAIQSEFASVQARIEQIHTSGHAAYKDLKEFADKIDAKNVIPIHSFDWDQHIGSFQNIRRLKDGEVFP